MRRTWIKLYIEQTLRGNCFNELEPDERFVWFGFLLLAGDNAHEGKISITESMGYSTEQLANLLKCSSELIKRSIKKMIKVDKIRMNSSNIISITNWKKYQSEYSRQRNYREEYRKIKERYKQELQRKVTTSDTSKSADGLQYISLSYSLSKDINIIDINIKDIDKYIDKEYILSAILYKLMLENNPKCKVPDGIMWATYIDKMIRLDGRDSQEILEVIKWCQADEFWKTNILSTEKLRKQYDQLYIKMNNKRKKEDWKKEF